MWWLERGALDVAAMREAAGALLGEHDFLSYCKPREGATTIRTLRRVDVVRGGAVALGGAWATGADAADPGSDPARGAATGLVEVWVSADAFCHSMVRSLVGALVEVGLRRRQSTWPAELLEARSRETAAPLAPACGLTLEGVDYPPEAQWAERARAARRRRDDGCCGGTDRG